MMITSPKRVFQLLGLTALLTIMGTGLSGCDNFALPPIEVSISIVNGAEILAENEADGNVDVPLTVFCDLFSEEQLDDLIAAAGGPDLAMLIDIQSIELDAVTITATAGDFNDFTMAEMDMTLITPGSTPIDLGAVSNTSGLGATFTLMPEMPLDLLNDLNDNECGVPALHLMGQAPTTDIQFNVVAKVLIYTQVNL